MRKYDVIEISNPELAAQLVDQTLCHTLYPNTTKKVWWRCDKGHTWEASPNSRTQGSSCPYCTNKKVLAGYNDIATTHPKLADQLVNQSLRTTILGTSKIPQEWQCEHGHKWTAPPYRRTKGHGCPICSNNKKDPRYNTLNITHPELAKELANPSLATTLSKGSNQKVEWICSMNHHYYATPASRTSGHTNCPYCSGNKVLIGFNDLQTVNPTLATELVNQTMATKVTAHSGQILEWRCNKGHTWQARVSDRTDGHNCPICDANNYISHGEQELQDIIKTLVGVSNVQTNVRNLIPNQELDIVIPSRKIAIEFNGLYYHSERMQSDNNYHAKKYEACANIGYQLLHVWEDDWINNKDLIIRMLAHKLHATQQLASPPPRLYARQLTFDETTSIEARAFYNKNHIQGFVSATQHFALLDTNQEVKAMLSVQKGRTSGRILRNEFTYEIVRYATDGIIIGGFTKLLRNIERQYPEIEQWVTFSDNGYSDGNLYLRNGFALDKELPADYKYTKTYRARIPKQRLQKSKFKNDANLLYKDNMTERELAHLNHYYRIYDAGKKRWIKNTYQE